MNHKLLGNVAVRDQIGLNDIPAIRGQGYKALISLRPDGEAADQPHSSAVESMAREADLAFAYIPVPKGDLPDAVVDELSRVLAAADGPILLYCRSGNRAARAWALAEASRAGGPSALAIVSAVHAAGQSVEDLLPRIQARIATRNKT